MDSKIERTLTSDDFEKDNFTLPRNYYRTGDIKRDELMTSMHNREEEFELNLSPTHEGDGYASSGHAEIGNEAFENFIKDLRSSDEVVINELVTRNLLSCDYDSDLKENIWKMKIEGLNYFLSAGELVAAPDFFAIQKNLFVLEAMKMRNRFDLIKRSKS